MKKHKKRIVAACFLPDENVIEEFKFPRKYMPKSQFYVHKVWAVAGSKKRTIAKHRMDMN